MRAWGDTALPDETAKGGANGQTGGHVDVPSRAPVGAGRAGDTVHEADAYCAHGGALRWLVTGRAEAPL